MICKETSKSETEYTMQCYDEYNGKNIKNGIRYYNGYPAKLQETIKPLKNK